MLCGWESLTPPGWDTNPSQVSSQQMLVLIYLPRKDGKLSWLRRKRRSHKYSNLGRARIELGTLWLEGRDLTSCANHLCPKSFTMEDAMLHYLGHTKFCNTWRLLRPEHCLWYHLLHSVHNILQSLLPPPSTATIWSSSWLNPLSSLISSQHWFCLFCIYF